MFDIRILNRVAPEGAFGEVIIDRHRENFSADLFVWNLEDYRQSWLRSAAYVLEKRQARFLVSVTARGMYETWECWIDGDEAVFHRSILLPSATSGYTSPAEGETPDPDGHGEVRETVNYFRCNTAALAEFEARTRGGALN